MGDRGRERCKGREIDEEREYLAGGATATTMKFDLDLKR